MPEDGGSFEVRLSLVEERVRVMEQCVQELRADIAGMNDPVDTGEQLTNLCRQDTVRI